MRTRAFPAYARLKAQSERAGLEETGKEFRRMRLLPGEILPGRMERGGQGHLCERGTRRMQVQEPPLNADLCRMAGGSSGALGGEVQGLGRVHLAA